MVVNKCKSMKVILTGLDSSLQVMECIVTDKCHTDDVQVLTETNAMEDWSTEEICGRRKNTRC